jgi:hypothetical protein
MGGAAERRESGRRGGATGPGAAVRGPRRHPGRPQAPVAGVEDGAAVRWEACARGRPGWWQGEGPRLDVYMYVCLWARGALSRVDFVDWGVEGGVAPCRAPTRYISPPNARTHVKKPASSLAACVASPRGRTGGRRAEGRRLPGPSRPRGPSHRAFNGGDGA